MHTQNVSSAKLREMACDNMISRRKISLHEKNECDF
jgi:hypothetical protein